MRHPGRPCAASGQSACLALCASLIAGSMPGCSSTPPAEALLPVTGAVKVEGQPLTTGWITFYPDEAHGNPRTLLSFAEIKKDGTYELTTNSKPGAPLGAYKVVIAASKEPLLARPPRGADGKPLQPQWLTHEKYTRPESTDVRIEVVEQPTPGSYDLNLSR